MDSEQKTCQSKFAFKLLLLLVLSVSNNIWALAPVFLFSEELTAIVIKITQKKISNQPAPLI